jgi:hypothetical protein
MFLEREETFPVKRFLEFVTATILVLSLAACGGGGAGGGSSAGSLDTDFPLPASVSNFTDTGDGSINFQTSLSIEDGVAFYREALSNAGLTERTINTAITDTTFSLVFDGDPSGKAVVVQGVDLGGGMTNINIRYEAV